MLSGGPLLLQAYHGGRLPYASCTAQKRTLCIYFHNLPKLAVTNKTTSQSEIPASLVNLLQNQHTFKAGINIKNGCTLLQQDYIITVGGQLDVGDEVTL